jgi:hypothetical protein
MKPLVAKEIRLLLPALVLALLLVIVPVWLSQDWTFPLFGFGGLMIALSSFGREFAIGTFPALLATPLSHARIWWTKIAVLICGLTLVFVAFVVALRWSTVDVGEPKPLARYGVWIMPLVTAFVTVFARGLWTTRLLRQMMAAFWIALLAPASILTLILWNHGTVLTAEVILCLYSVAGFVWAWRQFSRAEEVAWTGGEITLPDWQSPAPPKEHKAAATGRWRQWLGRKSAFTGLRCSEWQDCSSCIWPSFWRARRRRAGLNLL